MRKLEIESERVRLVLPASDEAEAVLLYFQANREHLRSTNPAVPENYFTLEFWQEQLEQSIEDFENDQSVRFFLELKDFPGRFSGTANFSQISRGPLQACYLGYGIDHEFEGKGLMFESLQKGISYIFDEKHIHRIMANYLVDNHRSAKVLSRLGFKVDGQSPDYLFIDGAWRTHVLSSLTNPDWSPRPEDRELFG